VLLFASDAFSYTTGAEFVIDGGMMGGISRLRKKAEIVAKRLGRMRTA
jgi:hypothetical protein